MASKAMLRLLIARRSLALVQRMIVGFIALAGIVQVGLAGGNMAIRALLAFFFRVRRLGGGNRYHGATEKGKYNQNLKQLHGILLG
jgi:hypothetical protein